MFKYKFCVWLVDTLIRKQMTYDEIRAAWQVAYANDTGEAFTERSFRRYCREAEILLNIDIRCDKSDGNRYKVIGADSVQQKEVQQWLLSAFRISNLARHVGHHERVVLEPTPPSAHLVHVVVEAIDAKMALSFEYKTHYDEEFTQMVVAPAFLRLFKQRWYLVGELISDSKPVIVALERMRNLEFGEQRITISNKCMELCDPQEYFADCYGILRNDYHPPQRIVVRAFWPQDRYVRDVPMHHSQREINTTEDYADFELFVRPTYDFKQELMWQRDKMAVIEPESFKETMIEVLEATLKGYRTGQSHAIDE